VYTVNKWNYLYVHVAVIQSAI